MAYLVLALGALLSVGGGLSIFYGAGIVEVERGWTGVIAGATSLTGGILTIALGLILRTLLEMRSATDRVAAAGARRVTDPVSPALPAVAPAVLAATPAEADLEGDLLAAFLSPQPDELVLPPTPLQAEAAASPAPLRSETVPEPSRPVEEPGDASLARSRFRVGFKNPAAEPPAEPEPPGAAAEPPPMPAMDDWLDRAFSSLDSELGTGIDEPAHRGGAAPPPPMQDEVQTETNTAVFVGHDVAELGRVSPHETHPRDLASRAASEPDPQEPAPSREAAPAAAAPPSQSAVIGRYEADGTSYVMFADGSIEAQSEAGVYRFSSMTELKAFIEGTG